MFSTVVRWKVHSAFWVCVCQLVSALQKSNVMHFKLNFNKSKKISNDQELIQSDPTPRPQNQKGNNQTHKSTAAHERHPRQTERTAPPKQAAIQLPKIPTMSLRRVKYFPNMLNEDKLWISRLAAMIKHLRRTRYYILWWLLFLIQNLQIMCKYIICLWFNKFTWADFLSFLILYQNWALFHCSWCKNQVKWHYLWDDPPSSPLWWPDGFIVLMCRWCFTWYNVTVWGNSQGQKSHLKCDVIKRVQCI